MRLDDLRLRLIVLLALAAALSVAGNKLHDRWLVGLSYAVFAVAAFLILRARRGARVFDREAKTDETGARPDE
jgi:Kef-type K+ transport system membrane component KefB